MSFRGLLSSLAIATVAGAAGYWAGLPNEVSTEILNLDISPDVVVQDKLGVNHIYMGAGWGKTMPLSETNLSSAKKEKIRTSVDYFSEQKESEQGF